MYFKRTSEYLFESLSSSTSYCGHNLAVIKKLGIPLDSYYNSIYIANYIFLKTIYLLLHASIIELLIGDRECNIIECKLLK